MSPDGFVSSFGGKVDLVCIFVGAPDEECRDHGEDDKDEGSSLSGHAEVAVEILSHSSKVLDRFIFDECYM